MESVYQTATKAGHTLCPMQFVPKAPYNIANTSARDTDKFWDRKNAPQTKSMWPIAFAWVSWWMLLTGFCHMAFLTLQRIQGFPP